jgi:hypothetical protein
MLHVLRVLFYVGSIALVVAFLFGHSVMAADHPYFNSSEPGCSGSDPDVLWCDDFEDASWFFNYNGPSDPNNDGWNGTPYGSPDSQGTNFGRCNGQGVVGTNCAASSGFKSGTSQGQFPAMADHSFNNQTSVNELYFRYYYKPLSGFQFGQMKALRSIRAARG